MQILKTVLVAAAVAASSVFMAVPAGAASEPVCPREGAIKLEKTADKTTYKIGDTITFTLTVTALTCPGGGEVTDTLPAGLTAAAGQKLSFDTAVLPAGDEQSFTVVATATQAGTLVNKAKVEGLSLGDVAPDQEGCGSLDEIDPGASKELGYKYGCGVSASASREIVVTDSTATQPRTAPTPTPSAPTSTPKLPNTGKLG